MAFILMLNSTWVHDTTGSAIFSLLSSVVAKKPCETLNLKQGRYQRGSGSQVKLTSWVIVWDSVQ